MAQIPNSVRNKQNAGEISKKISNFLSWREPYKQKWDRYYGIYRSHLEDRNYPWQANIFVPYAFSTVETIVPRLVSSKPQIDILPREKGDEIYAEVQAKLIDYQWDQMGMDEMMPDVIRQALIYGTSILKVTWERKEADVSTTVELDPEYPELGDEEVTTKEVVINRPKVEMVDLYDFMWDPMGYSIKTCSWVAHRTRRSYKYLLEMQKAGIYKNVTLLKDQANKVYQPESDFDARHNATGMPDPEQYGSGSDNEDNIEIIEYYEDDKIITLANRSIVIREEKQNPFNHGKKPFVRIVDQSVPKEFCGIGEIEPIETLQYELNDMRNQRMDNAVMVLNRMWKVKNGAGVDEDELISDVGGIVHTDDMEGLEPIIQQDLPNSSYKEETLIKADIQQTTGITDYTKGVASDALANETATGISLLQEAGNSRLRLKMLNVEYAIKEIGEFMVSLNKQFIDEDTVIRITGDDGIDWATIKPSEVRENFDVTAQAGSRLEENDAIKRKQALEMYQLFAGDPDINQIELKRRVFQSRNEKNIDKLFMNPENPQAIQQGAPQASLSNVPGGIAGVPGAPPSRNAEGVQQEGIELNRGVKETK